MSDSTATPAAFDWDSLVPAEAAPMSVKKVASPFDALTLPAAIRDRIEASLVEYVTAFSAHVAKGNKPQNFRYDWKVQAFPTLEMANKFVTWAKKYAQFRPDVIPQRDENGEIVKNEAGEPVMIPHTNGTNEVKAEDGTVTLVPVTPAGQITVRLGKPGPYTPPGADKVLHEIAVRYVAKPLEKSDTANLPGSAAGQNGTPPNPPAETPAENPPAEKAAK